MQRQQPHADFLTSRTSMSQKPDKTEGHYKGGLNFNEFEYLALVADAYEVPLNEVHHLANENFWPAARSKLKAYKTGIPSCARLKEWETILRVSGRGIDWLPLRKGSRARSRTPDSDENSDEEQRQQTKTKHDAKLLEQLRELRRAGPQVQIEGLPFLPTAIRRAQQIVSSSHQSQTILQQAHSSLPLEPASNVNVTPPAQTSTFPLQTQTRPPPAEIKTMETRAKAKKQGKATPSKSTPNKTRNKAAPTMMPMDWVPDKWAYGEDFGSYGPDTDFNNIKPEDILNVRLYDANINVSDSQLPPGGFQLSDRLVWLMVNLKQSGGISAEKLHKAWPAVFGTRGAPYTWRRPMGTAAIVGGRFATVNEYVLMGGLAWSRELNKMDEGERDNAVLGHFWSEPAYKTAKLTLSKDTQFQLEQEDAQLPKDLDFDRLEDTPHGWTKRQLKRIDEWRKGELALDGKTYGPEVKVPTSSPANLVDFPAKRATTRRTTLATNQDNVDAGALTSLIESLKQADPVQDKLDAIQSHLDEVVKQLAEVTQAHNTDRASLIEELEKAVANAKKATQEPVIEYFAIDSSSSSDEGPPPRQQKNPPAPSQAASPKESSATAKPAAPETPQKTNTASTEDKTPSDASGAKTKQRTSILPAGGDDPFAENQTSTEASTRPANRTNLQGEAATPTGVKRGSEASDTGSPVKKTKVTREHQQMRFPTLIRLANSLRPPPSGSHSEGITEQGPADETTTAGGTQDEDDVETNRYFEGLEEE